MFYTPILKAQYIAFTGNIHNYMTVDGYTKRSGAPTDYKVQIKGSNRWYRVYCIQTSNSGTHFIKTKDDDCMVVCGFDVQAKAMSLPTVWR